MIPEKEDKTKSSKANKQTPDLSQQTPPPYHSKPKKRLGTGSIVFICLGASFLTALLILLMFGFVYHTLSEVDQLTDVSNIDNPNHDLPKDLDDEGLEEIYDLLREKYYDELDYEQIKVILKKGLLEATGDQNSTYYTEAEFAEFIANLKGNFVGIGVMLGQQEVTEGQKLPVIEKVFPNTPAATSNLKAGNIITHVDGQSTTNLDIVKVTDRIKGEADTEVTLTIKDSSQQASRDVKLVRKKISIPSLEYSIRQDNVGVLEIHSFVSADRGFDSTADLMDKAVAAFEKADVKSIILDLRYNSGGELSVTVPITAPFLKSGDVVFKEAFLDQEVGQTKITDKYKNIGKLSDKPVVILVNSYTASASEIVAAAIKHNHKDTTIIGTKTYGKDTIQDLIELLDGPGHIKLTIRQWLTPTGESVSGGITPDVLKSSDNFDY